MLHGEVIEEKNKRRKQSNYRKSWTRKWREKSWSNCLVNILTNHTLSFNILDFF